MRPRRRDFTPIVVALVAAAVGFVGCAVAPRPPSAPLRPATFLATQAPGRSVATTVSGDGLLLLAGRPGAMGLELVSDQGERRPIALPDPDVAWLSTSLDGRALVTTRDGRAFVSDPLAADARTAWRPLSTGSLDLASLAGPLAFGTLSPDGTRAAFIAADFTSGGPFDLVVVPTTGAPRPMVARIPRPPEGAAPTWAGRRIVVLARTPADQVGTLVVEPDGGLTDGPSPLDGMSIAAAADRLAIVTAGGRVEIDPATAWLAGTPTTPTLVGLEPEPDGSRSVAWSALAPGGDRLALVRTNEDGESLAVTVHQQADDWRQSRRIDLPAGADRAVVAWLP